jgi:uncharacterized membrane protein YagU involved in acid resistance
MDRTDSPFTNMIKGAVAGLLATVPMTLFMRAAWRLLPRREQYPLPPRLITTQLVRQVQPPQRIDQDNLTALTLLLHFLFGAAMGAIYGVIEGKVRLNEPVKGTLMGTAVWSGSYLGWLPLLGILTPATEHPKRRNVLMIVAHFIWGGALGVLTQKLKGAQY